MALVPPGVAFTVDSEPDCHAEMAMDDSMARHHMPEPESGTDSDNPSHCQQNCANQGSDSCMDGGAAGCAFMGNASSALFLAPNFGLETKMRRVAVSTEVPLAPASKHPGPELRPPISPNHS